MQDLKVTSWQLFGHDRLYVNLPDGTAIGWADRGSGTITVLHPRYRDAVTDALARQVPDLPALVGEEGPAGPPAPRTPPQVPRIPPVRGLRKRGVAVNGVPAQKPPPAAESMPVRRPEPGETGQPVEDGTAVAGPGRPAGGAGAEAPGQPGEGVTAEAPGQPGEGAAGVAPAAGEERVRPPLSVPRREGSPRGPVLPALTPANDLAARRPGAALRNQLGESGTGALVRAATGALRRHKDPDPRRSALAGERRVGAELKRLTRHGWRVLHSVPLPDGTEIGHLLMGPGGVFAVGTEHRPGASVRIGDGTVRIDEGTPQPYVLDAVPGTRWARAVLGAHCVFEVPVQSVLVFTGVTALEVVATPPGIRVCRERQVSALAPLSGVLTPTQVERVYDVARNGEAWLDA